MGNFRASLVNIIGHRWFEVAFDVLAPLSPTKFRLRTIYERDTWTVSRGKNSKFGQIIASCKKKKHDERITVDNTRDDKFSNASFKSSHRERISFFSFFFNIYRFKSEAVA